MKNLIVFFLVLAIALAGAWKFGLIDKAMTLISGNESTSEGGENGSESGKGENGTENGTEGGTEGGTKDENNGEGSTEGGTEDENNGEGSTEGGTEDENNGESVAKNTITKDEWLAVINSVNYSSDTQAVTSDGDVWRTDKFYSSETAVFAYILIDYLGMYQEEVTYGAVIDGIGYTITKQGAEYIGTPYGPTENNDMPLSGAYEDVFEVSWEAFYDYLVYDENSNTYKADCTYSGEDATFEVFFEDGKLSKFEIKIYEDDNNTTITFSKFGTTVIEVPDFTLKTRTTITEDEWIAAINSTNHSMVANTYLSDGGDVAMTQQLYCTEAGYFIYEKTDFAGLFEETAQYGVIIDGTAYNIVKEASGYVGIEGEKIDKIELKFCDVIQSNLAISSNDVSWEELYDYLVYDPYSESYKTDCTYATREATFEAFFEDGKAVKFEIKFTNTTPTIITYSNFGTTVIEVPEFTLAEEVRTTITEEEWAEFLESNNFTYDYDAQGTIKMTESVCNVQQGEYNLFYIIIDDVLYVLQPYEDSYIAIEYTYGSSPFGTMADMFGDVAYDSLVYNAGTKSYTVQYSQGGGVTGTFTLYFENGKIVRGDGVMVSTDGTEANISFYNFGTTVIEVPDFTLA